MAAARLTWAGHATVRIELAGAIVVTDPVLSRRVGHLRRLVPEPPGVLDAPDAVLISHLHRDHLDLPTLRRIDPGVPVLAPVGGGALLSRAGRREIVELAPGAAARVNGLRIRATPAAHDGGAGARGPAGRRAPRAVAVGFVVEGPVTVYFAGDTDLFDEMTGLVPRLDVALVPVGGWGPTLGPGHLDAERAGQALARLRPRIAVPVHWGTYAPLGVPRGARYLRTPGADLARAAALSAPGVEVRVLSPGGSLELRSRAAASSSPRTPPP